MPADPVPAAALYGSLLTILTIFLAINVSRNRGKADVFLGHGDVDALHIAQRAHGNAAEYVPLGILMLIVAEVSGASSAVMHSLGGSLLLARVFHAHGLLATAKPTRIIGATVTWLSILGAAGYVLFLRFT